MSARPAIQNEADALDRLIFNALMRAERLAETTRARSTRHTLQQSIQSLRAARAPVRLLMHADDVEATR